tara:strand:- start:2292 stop:3368 length:1077 start_codon:yes stop_codon:yes gene_type:complete
MRLIILSTPIGFLGSGRGGGVEITLNSLVSGLLKQKHSVSVIAPINSNLSGTSKSANLITVEGLEQKSWQHQDYYTKTKISEDSIVNVMLEKALSIMKNNDAIINLSYDFLPICKTLEVNYPILHLISMGDESLEINNAISKVYSTYPHNFAFHSRAQASDYPYIKEPIILGNGFELSKYKFQEKKDGPLGWVGRVAPEKGLEDAVYVANKFGEKLNVWGFVEDKNYASKIEANYPAGQISWRGYLQTNQLQKELGKCRALINTPKWNEAYGNVIVEAMACGVPVVAYKKGGPSEIIQHGETGFLVKVDDKESLLSFIKKINTINRKKCREWVENNASADIFANKVVCWLKKVIKEYE